MTQNDFLHQLLILPPFIVYLVILISGFGSLLLVAMRTKVVRSALLKNPAFIIGDAFLLPAAGGLITFFYQTVSNPVPATTLEVWHLITLAISLAVTTGFGIKLKFFNRRYIWGLPHGIFHLFFTYLFITFVSKGFLQLVYGESNITLWVIWISVILAILIHHILGTFWPKKIPFE